MKPRLGPYLDHIILAVLACACYAMFFHELGGVGLIGPDEPRYAAVAREMLMSGDYVTPHLNGSPWFEKPPLMYWIAVIGYTICGINEYGARFPSALGATISLFLIYWCGRRLWSRAVGFLASLVLATSIGWFAFARAASMDMPLTACLTAALVFFLFGFNDETPRRKIWFNLFYASIGLGVLAKGPVAILLPAISLSLFLLTRGRLQDWRTWNPKGLWIAAAVAAPWYVLCTIANGWEFIDVFFINHNLQRFATTIHGHYRPFYFYGPVFLLLTFPWTFMLIPAMRRRFGKNELILVWWMVVPLVFYSLSGSKLPGYILPVVAPFALLCAMALWQPASKSFKAAVFIEAGTLAFIGVAFGFFGHMINVDAHVSGMLIAAITFGFAAVLAISALWLNPSFLAAFNSAVMVVIVLTATNFVFPRFDQADTMRPWSEALNRIATKDQIIFMYKPDRWVEYGLEYYRFSHAQALFSPEQLAAVAKNEPRILCLAEDKILPELSGMGNVDLEIVESIGNQTAFWAWRVD